MENTTGIITEIDNRPVAEKNAVILTDESLNGFGEWLHGEERSSGTIEKYLRDIQEFSHWLNGRKLTKETAALWRECLLSGGYAPVTVNSKLAAVNAYCHCMGLDIHLKFAKIQRKLFREQSKELPQVEYRRLVETAYGAGNERLALLMETICASGIRVSEVPYITVEAVRSGKAVIALKGKIRTILLPGKLCRKLLKYAGKQKIASGEIFLTGSGKSLSRGQIWAEMKRLCKDAGVEATKVFPHNLRHLFATTFYRIYKDVVRLADILGHSSVDTTRIYLLTTGAEHQRQLEKLGLVS